MKALILATILLGAVTANAQQPAIRPLLQAAAMGKTEEVRKKLPDLLADYPDDAGVQYLHATIIEDAAKAAPLFEKIVKNYPNSEWADDAEWRVVQYYAMKKDTARARTELASFRVKYPQSEFLLAAADAVKFSVGSPAHNSRTATPKEIAIAGAGAAKSSAKNTPAAISTKSTAAATSGKKEQNKSLVNSATKTTATKTDAVAAKSSKVAVKSAANDKKEAIVQSADKVKSNDKSIAVNTTKTVTKPAIEKAQANIGAFPVDASGEKTNTEKIEAATFEKETHEAIFSLQVGSYATKEQADNEVKNFHGKRLRASVEEKNVQGATKYAVLIGEYTSRSDAEKARVIVEKQCACKPFIVNR